jgi:hypothetical protein
MDNTILVQELEIVVNLPDIPIKAIGEGTHTVGWRVHQTPDQLQAPRREDTLESAGILEVDDVWNLFPLFPLCGTVKRTLFVFLEWL